jgi:hypothetical protein
MNPAQLLPFRIPVSGIGGNRLAGLHAFKQQQR